MGFCHTRVIYTSGTKPCHHAKLVGAGIESVIKFQEMGGNLKKSHYFMGQTNIKQAYNKEKDRWEFSQPRICCFFNLPRNEFAE